MTRKNIASLSDLERLAQETLPEYIWDYYSGGADNQESLVDNTAAFTRLKLRPRVMRDVRNIHLHTANLESKSDRGDANHRLPIGISPSAMQCLCHKDGEAATARAAKKYNIPLILSTFSTVSLEDVARVSGEWLIKRAEAAGFKAIVVTVDTPVLGRRRAELKTPFRLPEPLKMANFDSTPYQKPTIETQLSNGMDTLAIDAKPKDKGNEHEMDMRWESVIPWLRNTTRLRIILKGIMTEEDTILACEHGVDGIMVSNHGGRQLDGVSSTIDVLAECVAGRAKAGKGSEFPIYIDGGIRQGSDVVKALCLGADGVFIGRPVLWGLASGGQAGVEQVFQLLEDEIKVTMRLLGVTDSRLLNSSYLARLQYDGSYKRL